jgi:hypothetical protein
MILNVQEGAPPKDKEIYIVVIRKAFIHKTEDGSIIWNPINEDLPIGYILAKDIPIAIPPLR